MNIRYYIRYAFMVLIACTFGFATLAFAQVAPGDSCSGFNTGATMLTSDTDGDTSQVVLVCDGTNWNSAGVKLAPNTATCGATREGALRWSSAEKTVEMCDGSNWRKIVASSDTGVPSTPPANTGYFVITSGSWDADLQTASGESTATAAANSLCYTDLTNNDWFGKSDASSRSMITQTNIKGFVCYSDSSSNGTCSGNLLASTEYTFAVSGDPTKGGATMTTDASGYGPNNSQNWSGTNYFDGAKEYWSGGRKVITSTQWNNTADYWASTCGTNPNNNSGAFNDTAGIGLFGNVNSTNGGRWSTGGGDCSVARHLICVVHP